MSDFETMPIGSTEELKRLREKVKELSDLNECTFLKECTFKACPKGIKIPERPIIKHNTDRFIESLKKDLSVGEHFSRNGVSRTAPRQSHSITIVFDGTYVELIAHLDSKGIDLIAHTPGLANSTSVLEILK